MTAVKGSLSSSSTALVITTIEGEAPPSAITNLSWDNISYNYFIVTWSGGDGATSYTYTLDGAAATPSSDDGVGSKSATFSGLASGTSYSLVVTAVKGSLSSSSTALVITTIEGEATPSAITGMTSSSITSSGFSISWSGGDGATSYTYTLDGATATPSTDNGVASKSATFSGLSQNDSYSVVITAVNSSGNTSSSSFNIYRAISLTNSGISDSFIVKYNSNGIAEWARKIGGSLSESPSSIILDASANVYVCGNYNSNTLTIYNADGTSFADLTNSGNYDIYIVKYNSNGTPQWARRIGGIGNDQTIKIKLDSSANVYISGIYFSNPLTIYNVDGTSFADLTNSGVNDIYIVKYNSGGTPQWARRAGGGDSEAAVDIKLDNSSNIYMYGYYNSGYYGSNPFIVYNSDGSSFAELITTGFNVSSSDFFILKYNSDGTPQWLRRIGGSRTEREQDMTFDSSYNIYICGSTGSSSLAIFNSDGSSFAEITNPGNGDFQYTFIVKYNSSGTPQWVTKIGISSYDFPANIVSDYSDNIYVSGVYQSNPLTIYNTNGTSFSTLPNSGSNDIYIVKYNSNGTPQWARRVGGSNTETPTHMIVDASANVYISGYYASNGLTIYNEDESSFTALTNSGLTHIFIVKYNSSGTPQWATKCNNGRIMKMILDTSANIYISGYYQSTPLTIYNNDGSSFTTLTNDGSSDTFIVKYNSSGIPQWGSKISGNNYDSSTDMLVDSSAFIYIYGTYRSIPLRINSYII